MSVFSLMLVIPLLGTAFGIRNNVTTEKRTLAEMPGWSAEFPARFEAFYNDHFGFRSTLVAWRSRVKVSLFKESPTPLVAIGKDGWLFYTGDNANQESMKDYAGLMPLSPAVLQSMLVTLVNRRDRLARNGSGYMFVIAPNKQTIYGEYTDVPRRKEVTTRLDQFVAYMDEHRFPNYLDLRQTMIDSKQLGVLYYRIDSHWNMLGGWVAQHRILEKIHETLPVPNLKPLSAYRRTHLKKTSGDLTQLMGINGVFLDEDILIEPQPFPPKTAYVNGLSKGYITETSDERLPTLVMFGDSFLGASLADYLAEHFRRAVFILSTEWNQDVVDSEKPDLVITEVIERNLAAALTR